MAAFHHHSEYLNRVCSFCPCDLSAAEEYISLCTPKSPSQFEHQVSSLRTSPKKQSHALSVFAEEANDVSTGGDV